MIRFLVTLLLVLIISVSLVLLLMKDPGYVLISIGDTTVETTLALFALVVFVGTYLFVLLLRILRGLLSLPERLQHWSANRKSAQTIKSLYEGLLELARGHWKPAERALVRSARKSAMPLVHYLGAARAAQQQGALDRRDQYLQMAYDTTPEAGLALGLTRAELQIQQGQQEEALANLRQLRDREPDNAQLLSLLAQVYRSLGEWEDLQDLLPDLRKRKIYTDEESHELDREIALHLLDRTARRADAQALRMAWNNMHRYLREEDALILAYARHLMKLGEDTEAEGLLRHTLKYRWNEDMVELYGRVQGPSPDAQLKTAESWLKEHANDPQLLLALGRLCMRNRLWGKARQHLEGSIEHGDLPDAYHELGKLLEQLGDHEAALRSFRNGMALCVQPGRNPHAASEPEAEAEEETQDKPN